MPRKPRPEPETLTALLMEDDSVSDRAKIQWARALSGEDLRKPIDEKAETLDWLAGKFEAEARRRHRAVVQANARRHIMVIGFAIIFTVVSVAIVAQMQIL